jgi:hypothetical protein
MAVIACGCRSGERRASPDSILSQTTLADSLAASFGNGVEVWFTLARAARGNDGTNCQERAIEIRHGQGRVQVPLLYTGERPTLLNDSTMRAVLWNHCEPVAKYRVDLRTGRPVPERGETR